MRTITLEQRQMSEVKCVQAQFLNGKNKCGFILKYKKKSQGSELKLCCYYHYIGIKTFVSL